MAEPVRARRLTDQEGRRLLQIVRRGKHGSVRVRRAMIIMASASGTLVPAIARLVAAGEDTVRDVIHAFNARGLAALDPRRAGGRPRLISDGDIEVIVAAARTRPEKPVQPFTPGLSEVPVHGRRRLYRLVLLLCVTSLGGNGGTRGDAASVRGVRLLGAKERCPQRVLPVLPSGRVGQQLTVPGQPGRAEHAGVLCGAIMEHSPSAFQRPWPGAGPALPGRAYPPRRRPSARPVPSPALR